MHFNKKQHNIPSFAEDSEFDEATDPGLDRMATQYIVDPDAPVGGFPAPYVNTTPAPDFNAQFTPPFNTSTGGFQKVPTGFISSDQIAGELSSPGFQPKKTTGSFEQLSSAGMMSPGFQPKKTTGSFEQLSSAGMMAPGFQPKKTTGSFEQLSSAGMMAPGFQPQKTTGSFEQLSSAGMMSPGFQPQKTTGSFEQLSSAGMMSPGFLQPTAPKQTNHLPQNIIAKVRLRYILAATSCGAVVGFLLGILNTFMQGWEISQGTPQLMISVGLLSITFGTIAYFCKNRIDELLVQANLQDVIEFLNRPALTMQKSHTHVAAPGFQPPPNALYPRSPSGTFQTIDPDRTDEFPLL